LNYGLSTELMVSFRFRSTNWLSESLKSKSELTHCLVNVVMDCSCVYSDHQRRTTWIHPVTGHPAQSGYLRDPRELVFCYFHQRMRHTSASYFCAISVRLSQPSWQQSPTGLSRLSTTDLDRPARWRDFSRIFIHLLSATQNLPVYEIIFLIIPWTGLHLTPLCSGPGSSLYYLGHFKNPGLIDWLIDWLIDRRGPLLKITNYCPDPDRIMS